MKCKKCGTEFSEGIFCPMCGTKNEEVIINQEKAAEIERKERQQAEEAATAEAKKKIEKEKEIIKNNAEKNVREEAIKAAQEKARQAISSDDEDIKSEALKRVREEAVQNAKLEEENRKAKAKEKINSKAIVSLGLGIASWVGIVTVILPIVGGIWAIVDGCKALKGKTKYKKTAIWGIVLPILPILFWVLIIVETVQTSVTSSKRDAQLSSYIENGQYMEAQEFIDQEYKVGTLSYVEKCTELYELQGMYDEAVDLWVEYCTNEYEPIDIPDSRINKLNEYLDNEGNLEPQTVEKIHNLINSKEAEKEAKAAEEQAAREAAEEVAKEAEEQVAGEAAEQAAKEVEEDVNKENTIDYVDSEEDGDNDEENQTGRLEDRGFYTVVDFPYQNTKQANKLIKLYKKMMEADANEFITVECERKSIMDSSKQYKQTTSSSSYKYYGDMKSGLPHGQGCIMSYDSSDGAYFPEILGNFKNGQLDGYVIHFYGIRVSSEGNFKKGVEDGDYIRYASALDNLADFAYGETDVAFLYGVDGTQELYEQYKNFIDERRSNISSMDTLLIADIPLAPVYISETGEYNNGKTTGKWVVYYYDGTVRSEIKMDNNGKTGKGTIYYPDGTMQYTGEIKEGKYHGKGTLYREDGSVEYKGKFKNGNTDN